MLFKIYGKMFSVWAMSTISTVILVPLVLFCMFFPVISILAFFVSFEIDLTETIPGWLILGALPISILCWFVVAALGKVASVSLFITKEIGLILVWAPSMLLLLWFLGIISPSAFDNLCDNLSSKLDDLNIADML